MTGRLREHGAVLGVAAALTVFMTWPLARDMRHVGRVDNGDGMFSIWNVAWVARTLVVDPAHVFDANIFHPHEKTLAYSENNLGAGILAIPAYWLTGGNPYAALNFAVLLGFVLTAVGTFYLVHFLTCDRGAAAVSAIAFAFTPFVFAHNAHIQLLMTAGLPFSMLQFHRLTERTSPGRGAALGAVMAATAISCGYYGVFAILMVGYAALVVAARRRWWGNARYWIALGTGAVVSMLLVAPAFIPYASLQRVGGFRRALDEARLYAANWSSYFASAAHAHAWMLQFLPPWRDVAFPGFMTLALGIAGFWLARKRHNGEVVLIYGGLAVLACWASFGPAGGLYTAFYEVIPLFAWLRAPARFGLIVAFGLAVLAGATVSTLGERFKRRTLVGAVIAIVTAAELRVGSNQRQVEPVDPAYRTLATLPPGPVIELPFYYLESMFPLHTRYMLASTTHWMPLVNGYSDYFPPDFVANVMTLAPFPTPPAMQLLAPRGVRYAVFHMYGYNAENRRDTEVRLKQLEQYFRPLYISDTTRLYEIVGTPP